MRAQTPATSLLRKIERIRVDSVETYPGNPRIADMPAIIESLKHNLQYEPIVVQESTRRVLVGNHRLLAARELGWEEIDAVVVDVGNDHARRILLSSNRIPDRGDYDLELLHAQLADLATSDAGLAGTGYSGDYYDKLAREIAALDAPAPASPAFPADPPDPATVACPACGHQFVP